MKVEQDPRGEIRITDDNGFILCKFYECQDGFLISYDEKRVNVMERDRVMETVEKEITG